MHIVLQNINRLPASPELHEVHVYSMDFSLMLGCLSEFRKILIEEEIDRANRFHFEKDRNNFVLSRGILRIILAHYLNKSPREIILHFNNYGKPFIREVKNIEFNLSHSKDKLLLAFTNNIPVGIDIEFMNADFVKGDIAGKFFSPFEVSGLKKLPDELKIEGFYNCWTRKEALIKGIGKGLSIPLDSFDVELIPGKTPAIFDMRFDIKEKGKWQIVDLKLHEEYKSALALKSKNYEIKIFNISNCNLFLADA